MSLLNPIPATFSRSPVVARHNKFRMTKMGMGGPFKEFDRRYHSRLQPAPSLLVFGGQTVGHLLFPDSGRFSDIGISKDLEILYRRTLADLYACFSFLSQPLGHHQVGEIVSRVIGAHL